MTTPASTSRAFDLHRAARAALHKYQLDPDPPQGGVASLAPIPSAPIEPGDGEVDLRGLLWSSIDDDQSRDLDQIEVADTVAGGTRIRVGIADVDSLVPRGAVLDAYAARNATTVYTGVETFPMLPLELSTDRTSLVPNESRRAVVVEYIVAPDGTAANGTVYRAVVQNQAQLAYDGVGAWLAGTGQAPPAVAANAGLAAQLRLQHEAALRLRQYRVQRGALDFESLEANPIVADGHVIDVRQVQPGPARDLIEDFMIAANVTIATYLMAHQRTAIRRIVQSPKRWPRIVQVAQAHGVTLPPSPDGRALAAFLAARHAADPATFPDLSLTIIKLLGPGEYVIEPPGGAGSGHFGLAVSDYTHGTAPNRRYADLVTQRLVKSAIACSAAPYTDAELTDIAARCTTQEDNARHAARLVHKQAAAVMLASRIGETFDAIITGVTEDGTYARVVKPPVEGRVMQSVRHVDVGDRVRVRLLSTNPERGFIDFAAV